MTNSIEEFRSAMSGHGLTFRGEIVQDGRLHRFIPDGHKSDSGWYVLYPANPIAAGCYGDWRTGLKENWCARNGEQHSPQEMAKLKDQWRKADEQRARDEEARHARLADKATLYCMSLPAVAVHPYLETKAVPSLGELRYDGEENVIVLPLTDGQKIWSYQTIDVLGDKLFMPGGRVHGCWFEIPGNDGPIAICEGYATGASISMATHYRVICAMNCGNLLAVCQSIRKTHPKSEIVICADDDRFTFVNGEPINNGMIKASAAAKAIKATLVAPHFKPGSKGTDFNDLHQESGLGVVTSQINAAVFAGLGERTTVSQLLEFVPSTDPDCVIGDRFLCRGDSCVVVGQTHVGKSSIGMQIAVMLATGASFFGIKSKPSRTLKSLIVQAENNVGDMAEMFQGVLLGSTLLRPGNDDHNRELAKTLDQNLVFVRDQTRVGKDFCAYARRLIEIHKPDLFWIDPLLSFYGSDVNDQQAMSQFLRQGLNPISEQTGVIWMILHHTGKPLRENSTKGWSTADFAYMGLGSSEISNWARAIVSIVRHGEDEFKVVLAKRGWRAGAVDENDNPTNELYLAHSSDSIYWKRIPRPDDKKTEESLVSFSKLVTSPMSATEIVELATKKLQRGKRTCWKLWDAGSGPLGSLFVRDSQTSKYVRRESPGSSEG